MRIKILGDGPGIAGYIKIGQAGAKAAAGQKKRPPQKFDHIEITTRARNEAGQLEPDHALMDTLVEAANEKGSGMTLCGGCARSKELGYPDGLPTNLGIYLASDDPGISFPNRLCWYRGRHAYCWGDGEEAQRRKEMKGKDGISFGDAVKHEPCGNSCIDFIEGRCKPDARLRCSLAARQLVGAVYEFRTTSWNSIRNVDSCMKQVKELTGGTMGWVPLVFSLGEQVVQPRNGPANKAMVATLFFPGSAANLLQEAAAVHTSMGDFGRQLLEARAGLSGGADAWADPPEEVSGFAAEFHPEERDQDAPLEGTQEPEDGSGADKPSQDDSGDQEGDIDPVCGAKMSGGRRCHREPDHGGRHAAAPRVPAKDASEPEDPQEPEDDEDPGPEDPQEPEKKSSGRRAASDYGKPVEKPEDAPDPKPRDDEGKETSSSIEADLTPFQIEQLRRLLREQGKASAPAAKEFLGELLNREVTAMTEVKEGDFRTIVNHLDPELMEKLYQEEIF